jgi:hypothetical protein
MYVCVCVCVWKGKGAGGGAHASVGRAISDTARSLGSIGPDYLCTRSQPEGSCAAPARGPGGSHLCRALTCVPTAALSPPTYAMIPPQVDLKQSKHRRTQAQPGLNSHTARRATGIRERERRLLLFRTCVSIAALSPPPHIRHDTQVEELKTRGTARRLGGPEG